MPALSVNRAADWSGVGDDVYPDTYGPYAAAAWNPLVIPTMTARPVSLEGDPTQAAAYPVARGISLKQRPRKLLFERRAPTP